MTDDPFPAADIGFHQGTPVVPDAFCQTHAAMFGRSRGGGAVSAVSLGHRTRARWHDDRGFGMTGSDCAVDAVLVAALTTNDVDDGSQVGPLLDQIDGPIASFTADGA